MAGKSKTITLTNNKGSTMYRHTVELTFGPSDLTWASFDGDRVRFKVGTIPLAHWVEHYDSVNHYATIWVEMPTLATGTTDITMEYGDGVWRYPSLSEVPEVPRPVATGSTTARNLLTWPQRTDGTNNRCVHPCILEAKGWMKQSTPGVQDVTMVMVNTPWDSTLNATGWTSANMENPALWVLKSGTWQWPTGTASWRQTDASSTDRIVNALNRFHPVIMPIGTNCNAVVGPVCDKTTPTSDITSWSDPHAVWIESSQTLRLYFRLNLATFPLYYMDLTSTNGAWSGLVLGTPTVCMVNATDQFILANVKTTGYDEYLSPSVIFDGTYFWLFALEYITATRLTILSRWRSSDGITWTKQTAPTVKAPAGLHGVGWHIGVFIAGANWYLLTSSFAEVSNTYTASPRCFLMWKSTDSGDNWELCTPQLAPYYSDSSGSKPGTYAPYRPSGCYVEGTGLWLALGFASETGTLVVNDTQWRPWAYRHVRDIAKTFWRGGWDGRDLSTALAAANADGFCGGVTPYGVYLAKGTATKAVSGAEYQWTQTESSDTLVPNIDCPEAFNLRYRMRTLLATTKGIYMSPYNCGLYDGYESGTNYAYPMYKNSSDYTPTNALGYVNTSRATNVARTVDLKIARNGTYNAGYLTFIDRAATNSNTKLASSTNPFVVPRANTVNGNGGDLYNRWGRPLHINCGATLAGLAFTFAFFREGLLAAEETTFSLGTETSLPEPPDPKIVMDLG